MNSTAPIRSRAVEEGNFEIPLWGIPLVLIVLYVCLFSGLGALGLVGPDEPRYAAIARAMAETHDWVTPRLWGTPWFEKPVLYYWCAGIAMRVFGVSEFAARLPSALAALLAVVAVAWTARRSYGIGAAWYSLLMLPTSVAMIGFARAASPDMLFAGCLTASMAIAYEILQTPRPGPILQTAFGFFLGAAVLAKGPAAVILAGGATLLWATLSREWLAPFRFLHPLILAVFFATALPWYVLCALRNPDFLHVFIWQHNFERYLTPIFEHRQPFWFYGYIVPLAVVPWVVVLAAGIFAALTHLKPKAATDSPRAFFASWALFPILFFSMSQSKLPGYILPAIPSLFLLAGPWVSASIVNNSKVILRALGWTGALPLFFLSAPLGAAVRRGMHEMFPVEYVQAALVICVFAIGIILCAFRKRAAASALLVALMVTTIVGMADLIVLPRLDAQISPRRLAATLQKTGVPAGNLVLSGVPRTWQYGLDYYMNRDLPEWIPGKSEPEWILGEPPFDAPLARQYQIEPGHQFDEIPFAPVLLHKK